MSTENSNLIPLNGILLIYHHPLILRVVYNAIHWARPQGTPADVPRHVPPEEAREKITPTGPQLHDAAGQLR